jgi:hypothetical protein
LFITAELEDSELEFVVFKCYMVGKGKIVLDLKVCDDKGSPVGLYSVAYVLSLNENPDQPKSFPVYKDA